MVYNEEQGKEVFTPLPEVIRIMNEASRDPNTANGVSDMVDGYAEQSYMLPFKQGLFDYDTNYKNIYNNLVKNGDLETLNEYANLPNRIFRDDFIEMLMNNEYERQEEEEREKQAIAARVRPESVGKRVLGLFR